MRKGKSVIPDMGARMHGEDNVSEPIVSIKYYTLLLEKLTLFRICVENEFSTTEAQRH